MSVVKVADGLFSVSNGNTGSTEIANVSLKGDISVGGIVYASTVKNSTENSNEEFTVANAPGGKFLKWLKSVSNEAKANWWASGGLRFSEATFVGTQLDGIDTSNTKYYGGILLKDGCVLFIARRSGQFGIYNPTDNSFIETENALLASDNYIGGVLLPDGRVVFVPRNSTKICMFDPIAKTFDADIDVPGGTTTSSKYEGGVLLPDGRVVFVPFNSTKIGIFDTIAKTFDADIDAPGGTATTAKYVGGVLLPDGRVVFVPFNSTKIGIFDPVSGGFDNSIDAPGGTATTGKYMGGVLLPDGRVVFVPLNSTKIGIFDPVTGEFDTSIDAPGGTATTGKYIGGVLLPDGRVVFLPHNSTKIGIFDPLTREFDTSIDGPDGTAVWAKYVGESVEAENPKFITNNTIEKSIYWGSDGWLISASSTYGSLSVISGFDKGISQWASDGGYVDGTGLVHTFYNFPQWLQIQYPFPITVTRYSLQWSNVFGMPPKTWDLQGSNNNSTFETVHSSTKTNWVHGEQYTFNVPVVKEFKYWRVAVKSLNPNFLPQGDGRYCAGIAEFRLFALAPSVSEYSHGVLLPDGRVLFVPYHSKKLGVLSGLPPVPKERCLHPCFNKF